MITELTNTGDLDHRLNFESISSLSNLVDETLTNAALAESSEVYLQNGKINFSFLMRNAKILLAACDYDLAKSIFHTLIEHGEALGAAYAGLGVCYEQEGKIDLAVKAYKEAIIYEPSYTSLIALADLYIRKKEFSNAIQALLRANHLPKIRKKEFFEIHKNLGNCYMQIQELDSAEIHYQQCIELVKDSDDIQINLGCLKLLKGFFHDATECFQNALNINSENFRAYIGLGLIGLECNETNKAYDNFLKSLEKNSNNISALFYLVKCAYQLEKYDDSEKYLEAYILSNPYNVNILYCLAGILFHLHRVTRCTEVCEKILMLNPTHSGAMKLKELISISN